MNKLILLGACCLAQFSFASAKAVSNNSGNHHAIYTSFSQGLPKTVIIKTKKFKIKIDEQPNGKYRYQSWKASSSIKAKPDLVIKDGEYTPDGSGGNYYINFKNKGNTYQVWRNYLTDGTKADYSLIVNDAKGKEIVNEDGHIVKK